VGKTLDAITKINDRLHVDYENEEDEEKEIIIKKLSFAGKEISRVVKEDEINDDLNYWSTIVYQLVNEGGASLTGDDLIHRASCFIYIVAKETLTNGGADPTAKKVWDKVVDALEDIRRYNSALADEISTYCVFYDEVARYRLLEDRVKIVYEANLDSRFEHSINQNEREISNLEEKIKSNKALLESIEGKTAFTSLLSGFEQYSDSIKSRLKWVSSEVLFFKVLIFAVPLIGVVYSIFWGESLKIYFGLFSLLVVVGLLLRFSARKEDQLEQLLSNINTRTSLAVFHKYQLNDMDEGEKLIAHERFQSFIYSEIKTSEWNAPDVSASIAEIIKSARK